MILVAISPLVAVSEESNASQDISPICYQQAPNRTSWRSAHFPHVFKAKLKKIGAKRDLECNIMDFEAVFAHKHRAVLRVRRWTS
jgi:hypothetical protein